MEAHHVRYAQKVLVGKHFVAFGGAPTRHERTRIAHHLEAQAGSLLRAAAANLAHAHHAEGAAEHLTVGAMPGVIPYAGAHVGVGFVQAAQAGKCQRYCLVGNHFGAVAGNHAHRGAVLGGGFDVDAVVADSGTAYHLQVGQRLEHLCGEVAVRGNHTIGIGGVLDDGLGAAILEQGYLDTGLGGHLHFDIVAIEIGVYHDDLRHGSSLLLLGLQTRGLAEASLRQDLRKAGDPLGANG